MSNVTSSSINVIVQNLDTINFIKDLLLPLIGTLLGVISGAYLSYINNERNEKKLIIIKLGLNMSEELLSLMKGVKSFPLSYYNLKSDLNKINEILENGEVQDSYGSINPVYSMVQNSINKNLEQLRSNWTENHQNIISIVRYMEARKIPLKRLTPYIDKLLIISKDMRELWDSFYFNKYQQIILPSLQNYTIIDDNIIESFLAEWSEIDDSYSKVIACYVDLETALQNVFMGQLYRMKRIDYRKPLDPKYSVVRPLDK